MTRADEVMAALREPRWRKIANWRVHRSERHMRRRNGGGAPPVTSGFARSSAIVRMKLECGHVVFIEWAHVTSAMDVDKNSIRRNAWNCTQCD